MGAQAGSGAGNLTAVTRTNLADPAFSVAALARPVFDPAESRLSRLANAVIGNPRPGIERFDSKEVNSGSSPG